MQDFLEGIDELPIYVVYCFAVFSLFIAFFQTTLVTSFVTELLPSSFFFVLNPLLVLGGVAIDKKVAVIIFVCMFLSVFLLAILGLLFNVVISIVQGIKKFIEMLINSKGQRIKKLLQGIAFALLPIILFFGFIYNPLLLLLLFFIVPPLINFIFPGNRNRFLKLQARLPTSTLRSIQQGLTEVAGKLKMIEPLIAPLDQMPCIGYRYLEKKVTEDDEGRESSHVIKEQSQCGNFYLQDQYGQLLVSAEKLEFMWLNEDYSYRRGNIIYQQFVLEENMHVLLIGDVYHQMGKPMMRYDETHKVFMLAPFDKVTNWNKFTPLRRSFITTGLMIIMACIMVLIADVSLNYTLLTITWRPLW